MDALVVTLLLSVFWGQDATTPNPGFDVQTYLLNTESLLKAPTPDRLGAISAALTRLGMNQAARAVEETLKNPPTLEQLATELLRYDLIAPAREAIERWRQQDPDHQTPLLLHALVEHASGSFALALRDLDQLSGQDPQQRMAAALLRRFVMHAMIKGPPHTVESNPWDVQFAGKAGYQIGSIEEAERSKWTDDDVEALATLLTYRPASGYWWALLGELLNASGEPAAARDCMTRAVALQFSPRSTIEHLRALERHSKEQSSRMDEQLGPPAPASPATAWSMLTDQPRTLVVLIAGGIAILFIAVLQVRAWLHK